MVLLATQAQREGEVARPNKDHVNSRSGCDFVDLRERLWKEAAKDAESTPNFNNLKKQFPDKLSAEVPDGSWEKAFYCLPERIDPRRKLPTQ